MTATSTRAQRDITRRRSIGRRGGDRWLRTSVAAVGLVAATLVASSPHAAASFRDDASFGTGGRVITDFPGGDRSASAVLTLPDGAVIVGGRTNAEDFALYRLLADGTFDTTFGTGGFAVTDFFGDGDRINDLALQTDGKIIAAGSVRTAGETGFGLARYLPDGSPDPSFGSGGTVYTDPRPGRFVGDEADGVIVQPDGRIVAAGGSAEDFAVARYLSDGTLDPGFGAGGVALLDFGGFDAASDLVLQPDGRIVVGGQGATDFALARFLPDGTVDPTFGSGGTVRTDLSGAVDNPTALTLQPDGRIVLAGVADGDLALARYLPDGGLDPAFADAGIFSDGGSELPRAIALLADGRIVVGSMGRGGTTEFCFMLIEFSPAGVSGDVSGSCFGDGTSAGVTDLAVLPDGSVVAVGSLGGALPGGASTRSVVVRYRPNAAPEADAGGPYEVPEGGSLVLDASGSTDPDGDALLYQWDVDHDGTFETEGPTATFEVPRDDATLDVCMRVSDGIVPDGECTTVSVTNVAPHVAVDPVAAIDEGDAVGVSAFFSDPGSLDTYIADVVWGDDDLGTTSATIAMVADGPPGNDAGRIEALNGYGDDGSFRVRAEIRDDDGGIGFDETSLMVRNVAPSAAIHLPGATAVAGGPALIGRAGVEVSLEGRTTDPGSDDLTLRWDFGDGSAPLTAFSPVNPAIEDPPSALDPTASPTLRPRDVTDVRTRAFGESCLFEVTFSSADDDGGEGSASAAVLITGTATTRQAAGWWLSQVLGAQRPPLSTETLECYVRMARFTSSVFGEAVALGNVDDARAVLAPSGDAQSYVELLDRELLAAYLNFANGAAGYDRLLVDTDGDHAADATFGEAVAGAEAVRLDPSATQAEMNRQRSLVAQINRASG